ncbi:AMP-binding protein [Microbacterium elymi]|uniref:AMP-binding protein n=1 Tax=Microbacterium elymi TaxID=2909587 RepID=UPI00338E079A
MLVEDGWRAGALTVPVLAGRGDAATVDAASAGVSADDVADIVFTSGTTGHALGAQLTHDMLLRSAYGSAYHRAFDDGWRIGFALPLYHVFGYIEGMVAALFVGGAIVPQRVFNPRTALEQIERHRINEVLFVPTMTVAVVDQAVKLRPTFPACSRCSRRRRRRRSGCGNGC